MSEISKCFIKSKLPHVSQKKDMGCHFAAITMLLKYLGIDTNLSEVMHHSGVAHSLCSRPKFLKLPFVHAFLPSIIPMIDSGSPISQGLDDLNFLGNLFGLSCECKHPNKTNNDINNLWEIYWVRVKNYIKDDIPVYTGIDPISWPVYRESWNLTGNHYFSRGGHAILIIGFDERNGKVFFHDPYDFRINSDRCKNACISIDLFRKSVNRAFSPIKKFNFNTIIFRKISEPMPQEDIFEAVNRRNLRRIKGDYSAYDKELCQNLSCFGIEAAKAFREDLYNMQSCWKEIFYKFVTFFKYPSVPFEDFIVSSYRISEQKYDISNYLYENKEFFVHNENTALRLRAEAQYWKKLVNLFTKWNVIIKNNSIQKILNDVPFILEEIVSTVDDIILIEKEIIEILQ